MPGMEDIPGKQLLMMMMIRRGIPRFFVPVKQKKTAGEPDGERNNRKKPPGDSTRGLLWIT